MTTPMEPVAFRILIVEDDPRMRRVLELLLSHRWTVESAEDGEAALAMAARHPPDLVVADLLMPGLDGIELVRRLRADPATVSVPVIMVSGVTDEERRLEALRAGASDFLVKPFGERELVARMAAQLELAAHRREQSDSRMRAILDGALDAVIGMDAQGRITFWNPRAEQTFGWPRAEAEGRSLSDLVAAQSLPEGGVATLVGRRVQLTGIRRGGTEFPAELTVTCVVETAGPCFNAFVADITERRNAEAERERLLAAAEQARRQAEAASRAKDHFLATLSHELRTPLNAILGWAHLLRSRGLEPEVQERAVDVIERNARTQAQLIADMLEVTRIVQGKVRLDVRRMELPPVIEAVMDTVRPSAEAKRIELAATVQAVPALAGDPDRLQQVLWNLLSNAIKFTPKGGRVEVRLESGGSHLRLSVHDSGPGISRDFLPHVFHPFSQDTSSPRTHGGLGLGLAIARHLVEMHGGSIGVDSQPGAGTVFTVKLPLSSAAAEAPSVPPAPSSSRPDVAPQAPSRLDGVHVLVVDDEPDSCEVIIAMLQAQGATAAAVHNVRDALDAIALRRPHVLLTDIAMPGEDGYDLIRQLRALPPEGGGLMPVAALTAYARMEDRVRALSAGFHLHVAKPVDPAELVSVVANLAGRTRRADSFG